MIVVLSHWEIIQAVQVGVTRQLAAIKRKAMDANGDEPHPWQHHIEGAMAECAVCKAFGLFWNGGTKRFHAPDAGPFQVRQTAHENGCLHLHPGDADNEAFICAIGRNGAYRLAGWLYGKEGMKGEWLREPNKGRPCFLVQQWALRPMNELIPELMPSAAE